MKQMLRQFIIYSITFYICELLLKGLSIKGDILNLLIVGAMMSIIMFFIKPIIATITTPFNIISLGALSFLPTTAGLFILTVINSSIKLQGFTFPGIEILGFSTKSFYSSPALSFLIISVTIYILHKILFWIFE